MTEPKEPPPVLCTYGYRLAVWFVVGWIAFLVVLVLVRAR
jgi:hypothetical protein